MSLVRNSWARPTLIAACCALALGACSSLRPKPKPKLAYQERPVELLYNTGANYMDRHQWNQAVEYFQEVERQHPYSEWARRSILMQAFAHYEANNYEEAIADADRFVQLYPGNPAAAYAHYLKAVCYFEEIVDVGRDQAATLQALDNLREIVQRYPNSEYARDARVKIDMVNDQLAGKEMTIGRWYLRQGDTLAAIGRFKTVVDKYQTTTHTPEALYRLVEAYLTLGLVAEAKRNGAVLGYNYPGDPWYTDAYRLLTSNGLRPAVAPQAKGRRGLFHIPFRRDKSQTIAPPSSVPGGTETTASAASTAQPAAATSAPEPASAADSSSPTAPSPAPAPKKKRSIFHPF